MPCYTPIFWLHFKKVDFMQVKENFKHSDNYDGCLLNSLSDFSKMDYHLQNNMLLELIIHCA